MKLVIITGPMAVGKMTVGQELAKITGLKLFHNHMTIDLVSNFFSYGSAEGKRLVHLFRSEIFKSVAESDLEGLIFTYVWAFDQKSDYDYIDELAELFAANGGEIYIAELEADYDVRLERNKTPNRLMHKPTKRNLEWSENNFIKTSSKYRLNSAEGEIKYDNYIRINNTHLQAEEVARMIKDSFGL